jgi:LPXTG-motif cell wall-anchored protein
MNLPRKNTIFNLLALTAFYIAFAAGLNAQVKTETSTASGQSTTQVKVERGEVVWVNGNDLLVKMDDGSLRHFTNVPDSVRVTVDGKQLGIHDLQPGMKLERTITTTATPKTVTTVETVTGTVWRVVPPKSVTLKLEDGSMQRFTIPSGQKFMVNGQQTDAWGLRQGMKISATKVVEEPQMAVEQQRRLTGTMPPPPAPPAPDQPIIVAVLTPVPVPAPAPTAQEPGAEALPKTGSMVPLFGLLGAIALAAGLGLRVGRLRP